MARRKHLSETAKTRPGQAAAGGVAASDPATEEATWEISPSVDEAILAQATLQSAIDDLNHAMQEVVRAQVQEPQVPDKGGTPATQPAPPQRAAATAPASAPRPADVRNAIVALDWRRAGDALASRGYGAVAFTPMYYPFYGHGYPYYGYGFGYGLGYGPATYYAASAGYGHGSYGLGYPASYWASLRYLAWLRRAFC
jgi:hypothetical protein